MTATIPTRATPKTIAVDELVRALLDQGLQFTLEYENNTTSARAIRVLVKRQMDPQWQRAATFLHARNDGFLYLSSPLIEPTLPWKYAVPVMRALESIDPETTE